MKSFFIVCVILCIPIIPFVLFGRYLEPQVESWILSLGSKNSPLFFSLIVIAALACDIVLPIPSSVVGTLAGQTLGTLAGAAVTWLGLNLGCLIGYMLAWQLRLPLAKLLSSDQALDDVDELMRRWGIWAVIGLRPVPVLAEASVLLAGLARLPAMQFWPGLIAANLGLAIAYAGLGDMAARQGWLGLALAIALAVPVALLVAWLGVRKKSSVS